MILGMMVAPSTVFAENSEQPNVVDGGGSGSNSGNSKKGTCRETTVFGLDPWYAALTCDGNGEISQSNFQGDNLTKNTIPAIVGIVVKDLMFVAGFVAVGFVMYGGFLMVTSAGNPSAVEKAKKTISGALIGLVISILAYAIATTVMKVVVGE